MTNKMWVILVTGLVAGTALASDKVQRDIPVQLDLTDAAGVTFEAKCDDPSLLSRMVFYYRSGSGWYGNRGFEVEKSGEWQRIRMPKLTRVELKPSGWGKIDAVRLAAVFRDKDRTCGFDIRNITPIRSDGEVLIVRGASCGRATPALGKEILDYAMTFDETFDMLGVTASSVDDDDLTAEHLARAKLVILPYNRTLPDDKLPLVRDYVRQGRPLLMCYMVTKGVLPPALDKKCHPLRGPAKGENAWPKRLQEGNFVFLGHVWHGGLSMGGTTDASIDYFCGLIGLLHPALAERMRAERNARAVRLCQAIAAVREKTKLRPGERRVIWAHSPLGPRGCPGDWEKPVRILKDAGFTDMLVNMCWGYGCAYDSKVLPRAPVAQNLNWEPLDACRAACRRQGIKMHVWRVCWQVFGPPRSEVDARKKLAAEGRMQIDYDGNVSQNWLCPNHPANRQLEMDAMLELALEKDVDGIHYDYFRYADFSAKWCFCPRCRALFEQDLGHPVAHWPQDVRKDKSLAAQWGAFKRKTLSGVIGPVAERVHREKPGVEISIAARPDPVSARDDDGQDWPEWCRKGWLDFVCPMDYSDSAAVYAGKFRAQMPLVHGVQLLPGMGFTHFPEDGSEPRRFAEQVEAVRAAGLPGITFYSYTARSMRFLELLGQ